MYVNFVFKKLGDRRKKRMSRLDLKWVFQALHFQVKKKLKRLIKEVKWAAQDDLGESQSFRKQYL
jgi:hypothetical protein